MPRASTREKIAKRKQEEGFSSIALLSSFAAISMAAYYVSGANIRMKQEIQNAKEAESKEVMQNSTISSFAVVRSLLNESKVSPNTYQPAIYPQNYFGAKWTLSNNASFQIKSATAKDSAIALSTFGSTDSWFPQKAGDALLGKLKPEDQQARYQTEEVVVQGLVRSDPAHPLYVNAVDVVISPPEGSGLPKSHARIPLNAPTPSGMELWIKEEKDASYSPNFGTDASPRTPGKYSFQVRAAGVVHYAQMTINGQTEDIGVRDKERRVVTHSANNAKATMQPIGNSKGILTVAAEASTPPSSPSPSSGGPCTAGSAPATTTTTTNVKIPVSAKLIGVDGKEYAGGPLTKELVVKQTSTTTTSGFPAYTPENYTPEMANSQEERVKAECLMKNPPKIWDALNKRCMESLANSRVNCNSFQAAGAAGQSVINAANSRADQGMLTCMRSTRNPNIRIWTVVEVIGQCQAQIRNHCEINGQPASTPVNTLWTMCINQF